MVGLHFQSALYKAWSIKVGAGFVMNGQSVMENSQKRVQHRHLLQIKRVKTLHALIKLSFVPSAPVQEYLHSCTCIKRGENKM